MICAFIKNTTTRPARRNIRIISNRIEYSIQIDGNDEAPGGATFVVSANGSHTLDTTAVELSVTAGKILAITALGSRSSGGVSYSATANLTMQYKLI